MTDAELIEFVQEFRDGILDGHSSKMMCGAVCYPLVTLLNMSGVKAELVESDLGDCNHVWMKLEDGRALDPTGDQFNWLLPAHEQMPTVYLGPPTRLHAVT